MNIPLGSLWNSSKSDTAVASTSAPAAPETTGSVAAAPAPAMPGAVTSHAEVKSKSSFLSDLLPSFGKKKVEEAAAKPADAPFNLAAPETTTADVTGSVAPAAPVTEEQKSFAQEDKDAVVEVLAQVLPEKGSATSQSWINPLTGYGGMVVPMAQLKKTSGTCRDLLISFGKGPKKDWYKGQGCNKGGKVQLGDVTAWRTSK